MPTALRHLAVTATLWAAASAVLAQSRGPQIGYVYPAGEQQGTTVEVRVAGQGLGGIQGGHVSGDGVQVKLIEFIRPVGGAEAQRLRDRLRELAAQGRSPAAIQEIAEIRVKLYSFSNRPSPAIAEVARLSVTFAPDATPGRRELRVRTPNGLSNPLVFCVSQWPEFAARAADVVTADDFKGPGLLARGRNQTPRRDMAVSIPTVVNGQIMPGGVDRYRFSARKGQRLVAAAAARELIPYLADAVPGWFQAALTLYGPDGTELAFADHFRFHPDPALFCEIPRDGDYVLEVRDSIYRGRQDFVYRVTLGEVPWLTDLYPLGGRTGAAATV